VRFPGLNAALATDGALVVRRGNTHRTLAVLAIAAQLVAIAAAMVGQAAPGAAPLGAVGVDSGIAARVAHGAVGVALAITTTVHRCGVANIVVIAVVVIVDGGVAPRWKVDHERAGRQQQDEQQS
jgi:hypothetical protein